VANPGYRYVDLPDEINLSDPSKDRFYRESAEVAIPGLGMVRSPRTVVIPATHVAWGITLLKDAPNRQNAIRFLELLLGLSERLR
jgi:molybdate/tungstate transport system substrate-binding protein